MKNRIICLLALCVVFFTPAQVHAAFVVKRETTHTITKPTATSTHNNTVAKSTHTAEVRDMLQLVSPPSFEGMMGRGWIGIAALACGILGFVLPIFAIGAIIFGFMGLGRRNRNRGLAIAGFVLGIAAIIASI